MMLKKPAASAGRPSAPTRTGPAGSNPLSRAAVATKISASSEVPQFSLLTSGSGGRDAWHVPPEARYLQVRRPSSQVQAQGLLAQWG